MCLLWGWEAREGKRKARCDKPLPLLSSVRTPLPWDIEMCLLSQDRMS